MNIDYICPYPLRWKEIFEALRASYALKTGEKLPSGALNIVEAGGPPTPLILGGWVYKTDEDKKLRWIETIEWAEQNDLAELIIVDEKDKCYFAGYDHTGGLRGEYSDYTEDIISRFNLSEFITLNEYLQDPSSVRCKLPECKGIYFVIFPYFWPEYDFLEKGTGGFFKGKDPNIPITLPDIDWSLNETVISKYINETETLFGNWIEDADILYIGRAGGINKNGKVSNATLKDRIIALLLFGNGKRVGHWGGRYIWQHSESYDFRIYWYVCKDDENPVELEKKLLEEFVIEYQRLPFANLIK